MKRLKILLPVHVFFPRHFYGTETYTFELAKNLESLGHEPVVLTAIPYGEEGKGEFYTTYEYEGLPVHCIDLNWKPHNRFKQTYYRPELAPVLNETLDRVRPDLVHVTHLINHTSILLEVLRDRGIPAVATLTDFFAICFNNKLERHNGELCLGPNAGSTNCLTCYLRTAQPFYRGSFLRTLVNNDVLIKSVSRFFCFLSKAPGFRYGTISGHVHDVTRRTRALRYLYGAYKFMIAPTDFLYDAYARNAFYADRLEKINFGINLDFGEEFKQSRKSPKSAVKFGYIGQITAHKGVDLLVNAYKGVRGKKSLLIYGPPDQDHHYMKELTRISSGAECVEFRGTFPREELPARLSELDVLVIPSRWYENSPLVLLYALATKTPVVVTDVKGMSEFVSDDVNGYTFQMNNQIHLTRIMQNLVDHPGIIERLSRNAQYTMDTSDHARKVLALYEKALNGTP